MPGGQVKPNTITVFDKNEKMKRFAWVATKIIALSWYHEEEQNNRKPQNMGR